MAIEPRKPPSQFIPKLQRTLGGRAGWSGFVLQLLFVAALAWISYEIVANARANLQAQRITAGFGFLANNAGFDVSQNLIPYSGSDTYTRVFFVGLLNTLLVSVIGIFFATLIGFIVALGRLSPNWLLSRISGGYVELIRNLPVLLDRKSTRLNSSHTVNSYAVFCLILLPALSSLFPYTTLFRSVGYLHPGIFRWTAEHAAGLGDRHLLRHPDRFHRRARPAVAELAAVANFGRLCRTDT